MADCIWEAVLPLIEELAREPWHPAQFAEYKAAPSGVAGGGGGGGGVVVVMFTLSFLLDDTLPAASLAHA